MICDKEEWKILVNSWDAGNNGFFKLKGQLGDCFDTVKEFIEPSGERSCVYQAFKHLSRMKGIRMGSGFISLIASGYSAKPVLRLLNLLGASVSWSEGENNCYRKGNDPRLVYHVDGDELIVGEKPWYKNVRNIAKELHHLHYFDSDKKAVVLALEQVIQHNLSADCHFREHTIVKPACSHSTWKKIQTLYIHVMKEHGYFHKNLHFYPKLLVGMDELLSEFELLKNYFIKDWDVYMLRQSLPIKIQEEKNFIVKEVIPSHSEVEIKLIDTHFPTNILKDCFKFWIEPTEEEWAEVAAIKSRNLFDNCYKFSSLATEFGKDHMNITMNRLYPGPTSDYFLPGTKKPKKSVHWSNILMGGAKALFPEHFRYKVYHKYHLKGVMPNSTPGFDQHEPYDERVAIALGNRLKKAGICKHSEPLCVCYSNFLSDLEKVSYNADWQDEWLNTVTETKFVSEKITKTKKKKTVLVYQSNQLIDPRKKMDMLCKVSLPPQDPVVFRNAVKKLKEVKKKQRLSKSKQIEFKNSKKLSPEMLESMEELRKRRKKIRRLGRSLRTTVPLDRPFLEESRREIINAANVLKLEPRELHEPNWQKYDFEYVNILKFNVLITDFAWSYGISKRAIKKRKDNPDIVLKPKTIVPRTVKNMKGLTTHLLRVSSL
jgi:hypothetical protein